MGNIHKEHILISPEVMEELKMRRINGTSYRDLSIWLREEHHIFISHCGVRLKLDKALEERKEFANKHLLPYLKNTLESDLQLLDDLITDARSIQFKANEIMESALADKDAVLALKAQDRVLKAIEKLTHILSLRKDFTLGGDKEEKDHVDGDYVDSLIAKYRITTPLADDAPMLQLPGPELPDDEE